MQVKIGTRGSILALWQANFIKDTLKTRFNLESSLEIIKTTGDKILDAPLAKIGGKGLFTKELEEKLLAREITLAVHSLKDVPVVLPRGLRLAAITKREDARDCFLSQRFENLKSLPKNAKIGTTSLRRAMQLHAIRADIETLNLRGNIQTRLEKLARGEFDAIILAEAALNRLNLARDAIKFIAPFDAHALIPAMGQGALGIECREDCEILDVLAQLNDEKTRLECACEREFVRLLDGGCQVPIGVYAEIFGEKLEMRAILGLPNGKKIIRESISANINESPENIARILCQKVESLGAREVLKEALAFLKNQ